MKTMEPETKPEGAIDLTRYSKEKRQALEVTEDARGPRLMDGFASGLFLGSPKFSPLYGVIQKPSPDGEEGEKFLNTLEHTSISMPIRTRLMRPEKFRIPARKTCGDWCLWHQNTQGVWRTRSQSGNLFESGQAARFPMWQPYCPTLGPSIHRSAPTPASLRTEEQKKKFLPDVAKGDHCLRPD